MAHAHTSPSSPEDALGPLVVSERNPRYFTVSGDPSGRAVYLAGSHIWHNLQDGIGPGRSCSDNPEVLPLDSRVQELQERYIRHVVDTVHDLPNVLWEVANESSGGGKVDLEFARFLGQDSVPDWGDSTGWQ